METTTKGRQGMNGTTHSTKAITAGSDPELNRLLDERYAAQHALSLIAVRGLSKAAKRLHEACVAVDEYIAKRNALYRWEQGDRSDLVALTLIASDSALPAEVEYDLEERGLIIQTDQPYAELTDAGIALLRDAVQS